MWKTRRNVYLTLWGAAGAQCKFYFEVNVDVADVSTKDITATC